MHTVHSEFISDVDDAVHQRFHIDADDLGWPFPNGGVEADAKPSSFTCGWLADLAVICYDLPSLTH
jgi:hypothetical protein